MSQDFCLPIPAEEFSELLLSWYVSKQRELPWRSGVDPYRVWLSEIMLQQTRVTTVVPYFERFLRLYPTLEDLAQAEEEAVLGVWSGLGYYRRARNLHKAAKIIRRDYGGKFPEDYADTLALPGIGPYSAGAILSIAYGKPHPVLDGNVRRVLVRYLGIDQELSGSVVRGLWRLLSEIVVRPQIAQRVSDFNQSLMELGAVICKPKNPGCSQCPLIQTCRAHLRGSQKELPRPLKKGKSSELHFTSAVIESDGRYLMHRNAEATYLKGFWEFPRIEGRVPYSQLTQDYERIHRLVISVLRHLEPVRHQITFRRLTYYPVLAVLKESPPDGFRWLEPGETAHPVSSYVKKIFRALHGREMG